MQWEPEPLAGFTTGEPWLIPVDPRERSVAAQAGRPRLAARAYRACWSCARGSGQGVQMLEASVGVLAFARGAGHVVAINTTDAPRPLAAVAADLLIETQAGALATGTSRRARRLCFGYPRRGWVSYI